MLMKCKCIVKRKCLGLTCLQKLLEIKIITKIGKCKLYADIIQLIMQSEE